MSTAVAYSPEQGKIKNASAADLQFTRSIDPEILENMEKSNAHFKFKRRPLLVMAYIATMCVRKHLDAFKLKHQTIAYYLWKNCEEVEREYDASSVGRWLKQFENQGMLEVVRYPYDPGALQANDCAITEKGWQFIRGELGAVTPLKPKLQTYKEKAPSPCKGHRVFYLNLINKLKLIWTNKRPVRTERIARPPLYLVEDKPEPRHLRVVEDNKYTQYIPWWILQGVEPPRKPPPDTPRSDDGDNPYTFKPWMEDK